MRRIFLYVSRTWIQPTDGTRWDIEKLQFCVTKLPLHHPTHDKNREKWATIAPLNFSDRYGNMILTAISFFQELRIAFHSANRFYILSRTFGREYGIRAFGSCLLSNSPTEETNNFSIYIYLSLSVNRFFHLRFDMPCESLIKTAEFPNRQNQCE